jgi:hypothetical protein
MLVDQIKNFNLQKQKKRRKEMEEEIVVIVKRKSCLVFVIKTFILGN